MIRAEMINTAGMPKGCAASDSPRWPRARCPIERPSPQPQHPSKPNNVGIHRVTVPSRVGARTANPTKPTVQSQASLGICANMLRIRGLIRTKIGKVAVEISLTHLYVLALTGILRVHFFVQRQQKIHVRSSRNIRSTVRRGSGSNREGAIDGQKRWRQG